VIPTPYCNLNQMKLKAVQSRVFAQVGQLVTLASLLSRPFIMTLIFRQQGRPQLINYVSGCTKQMIPNF